MPKVPIYNQAGEEVGSQELSEEIFGVKPRESVVHQVVVAMLANRRQVLAHTKDRGEVRGGGRKPWRQKGTGRARHGSIRSPLWVGGGITFGPTKERNFKQKINDKMRRKAIFMCLSDRVQDGKLVLLDKMSVMEGKTKEMVGLVNKLRAVFYGSNVVNKVNKVNKVDKVNKIVNKETREEEIKKLRNKETKGDVNEAKSKKEKPKKILILIPEKDEKILRSCRNIPWLSCIRAQDANVLDILANEYILTSVEGVRKIEETFTVG